MSDQPIRSLYGESSGQGQEQQKPLNILDIISGVFSEPVELFKRLSKKPQWGGAMLVVIILTVAFSATWAFRVDAVEFLLAIYDRALPHSTQLQAMSQDDIEKLAEMQAKILPIGGLFQSLIVAPIFIFICGLIYWAIGLVSKEDQRWKPTYQHGLVAATVPSLVTIPYLLLGTVMTIMNPVGIKKANQMVPSSVAFWLETDSPKLEAIYGLLDPFILAQFVMIYFAVRYTLRAQSWGAILCVAIALMFPGITIWMAK
ncbi:MAG: YIP1 family protein [Holophagaceae bacterium]|nr:YIP1 family protein [Holophagaceae bacterium]